MRGSHVLGRISNYQWNNRVEFRGELSADELETFKTKCELLKKQHKDINLTLEDKQIFIPSLQCDWTAGFENVLTGTLTNTFYYPPGEKPQVIWRLTNVTAFT